MLKQMLGVPVLLAVVLGVNANVRAVIHWEIKQPAGANDIMELSLWGDDNASLDTPIFNGTATTSFFGFSGGLVDGTEVTIASLQPQGGFTSVINLVGSDLSAPLGFTVGGGGGLTLRTADPAKPADSVANALTVLSVSYRSDAVGAFEGAVTNPVPGSFTSTVINGSTNNVTGSSASGSFVAIPEPSSFALVGLFGVGGLGLVRLTRFLRRKS